MMSPGQNIAVKRRDSASDGMGTLYVVATPIGNLQDVSLRALSTLRDVALIAAEDTRVSAKLLAGYDIATPMVSYHQHSGIGKLTQIIEQLRQGNDVALVSDAGTPGINDPGGRLVEEVSREIPDVPIVPIPGPNAAMAALSVSGVPADRYIYLGFVPHKKGRQTFFRSATERAETQVFYESKHRISKALEQLTTALKESGQQDRKVIVARELTKKFESIYRGTASDIVEAIPPDERLGEFVVIVGPRVQ